jgi:kynurenine formamidase
MHAGIGTHMDAPAHCIPQAQTIDQLSLDQFIAPCVVIDLSAHCDERFIVSTANIQEFEARKGSIPAGSFVIVYTGWDRYWEDRDRYRNNLIFPSISIEAAQYLLSRKICGVGIDTLSPDRSEDGFLVHELLLGNGKYIVENVCNASKMPATGGYTFAMPMKMEGATEAPVRLIGVVPKNFAG